MDLKNEEIISIVAEALPTWQPCNLENVTFEPILSGVNKIYKLVHSSGELALFRIFGNSTCFDRVQERKIFDELAERGLAPKVLYQDEKVRIEEWLKDHTHIALNEVEEFRD